MIALRMVLIFGIFFITFPIIYGRKWYTYEPYWGSSHSPDESKFVEEKISDMHPVKSGNDESPQNTHLFKMNAGIQELKEKFSQNENEDNLSMLNSDDFETLETQVGEHLVKVTSKKESKSLSTAHRSGGFDTFINPKYSHVIEIIHRGDNLETQNKPALIYDTVIQKQVAKLKIPDSEKAIEIKFSKNPDKYGKTEVNSENFESNEKDTEESDEIEEEFGEADVEKSDETEGEEEEFGKAHMEESDETEGEEEEFGEADVEESEDADEFDEADLGDMEEHDEADVKEFGKPDEKDFDESDETEEKTEEFCEFNEAADEDIEFSESDDVEGDSKEFEADHEEDPKKSDEGIEKSPEESEVDAEEFDESNEMNTEETSKDEMVPEEFEVDQGNIAQSNEKDRDEILPDDIENIKKFEGVNIKKNETGNKQISDESFFNEKFEGSGEELVNTNDRNTTKTVRILGMFSRRNETSPTCTTQRGEAGHCRRLGECLLSEALSNFNGFLQQLCLIRGTLVGICCPDNPVIETVNPDDNTTIELNAEEIEQPPEGCGLNTKTRIVGGSISVPHEWTWMVALMRRNRFYCGGVIINNWYILTAAHCVMGMNVKDLTVRLGEYDFNEQSKHTEDLSVSEIKRHAQFVTLTFQHDIALLKLKRSIKYSKFVGSICLPEQKARDYSDVKGTVVGWGTVSFGGAASPVLRQVTVPVWKNKDCDRTYLLESIGDSFMCAGAPEKGEDACQGDSGGPLMTVNESGRWEVIGLVSWGRRCGDPTYPGVYTRVTTYLDWIKQNAV